MVSNDVHYDVQLQKVVKDIRAFKTHRGRGFGQGVSPAVTEQETPPYSSRIYISYLTKLSDLLF